MIKVVDFGIAGVCANNRVDKVDAGSLAYMPPECLGTSKSETSPMIDVWASGCMFYAMIYGYLPFWGDSEEDFANNIINAPLKFGKERPISKEAKNIIRGMLQKDPEKRSPMLDIMDQPYFHFE